MYIYIHLLKDTGVWQQLILLNSCISLNLDCHFIDKAQCIIDNEASGLVVLCMSWQGYFMMRDIKGKYSQ